LLCNLHLKGRPHFLTLTLVTGLIKDNALTLRTLGVAPDAKLMLVGSTITQVIEVNVKPEQTTTSETEGLH
jgi:hypothetical protein